MQDTPQELIDHIIDFAHDDRATLCSARLVSHTWNVSARVHVFRTLDLLIPESPASKATSAGRVSPNWTSSPALHTRPNPSPKHPQIIEVDISHKPGQSENVHRLSKLKWLLQILRSSPDMAHFVREVVIGNTACLSSNSEHWKTYEDLISQILPLLKRVKTVSFHTLDWSQLSRGFSSSLAELCCSSELSHLNLWNCEMEGIADLMDLLNLSSGLLSLRLSHIRIQGSQGRPLTEVSGKMNKNSGTISQPIRRPRNPLHALTIDTVSLAPLLYDLLANPFCSLDVSKLRSLVLTHIADVPNLRHILQVSGNSLEYLEMWGTACQSRRMADQGMVNLSYTPRLKSLRFSGLQWTSSLRPAECLRHIFDIPTVTDHPLESLYIAVNAHKRKNEQLDYGQWDGLDEVLSRPTFKRLKMVDVVVYVAFRPQDVDCQKLTASFPRLRAEKNIRVLHS